MKKIFVITFMLGAIAAIVSCEGKNEGVDCDLISGASFTSNGGQMQSILSTRCGVSECHAPGGLGTTEWTYNDEYDSIDHMFDRMYDAVITDGFMPPDSATQLTSDELDKFECWKRAGFPE